MMQYLACMINFHPVKMQCFQKLKVRNMYHETTYAWDIPKRTGTLPNRFNSLKAQLLLILHRKIKHWFYMCICVCAHTHTHTHTFKMILNIVTISVIAFEIYILNLCAKPRNSRFSNLRFPKKVAIINKHVLLKWSCYSGALESFAVFPSFSCNSSNLSNVSL
jgi:hypothetical protein